MDPVSLYRFPVYIMAAFPSSMVPGFVGALLILANISNVHRYLRRLFNGFNDIFEKVYGEGRVTAVKR